MTEDSSGTYVGSYTAQVVGDDVLDATVTGKLVDAVGNSNSLDSEQKVTIDTIPPEITSATFDKDTVEDGETVVLTVITEPGATVTADVSALDTTKSEPVSLVESTETPGTFTANITANADAGDKVVTITATDVAGNVTTTDATIELTSAEVSLPPTEPPVITKIGGKKVPATFDDAVAGQLLRLNVEATDPDGDIASYEIFSAPEGASIDLKTGVFTWTPTSGQVGTYTIEFIVNDAMGEYDSTNVTITVIPPSPEDEITSVTITGSPAGPDETITVTATGTPARTATFSIAGVTAATDVAMTEDPSGTYVGSYTAQAGDNVNDATITVKLGQAPEDTTQKVTIDTVAEITSVTVAGSPAKAGGVITVTLVGEANGTATFSIAGVTDATDVAMTEDSSGTYVGSYTAKAGDDVEAATVTVTLIDAVDNEGKDETQTVTIDTISPTIESVTVEGIPDTITVTLVGEPGITATFSIAGVTAATGVAMTEDPSGTYVGSYTVQIGDNVEGAIVTGKLVDAAGNETATEPFTIPEPPTIISAESDKAEVKNGDTFTLTVIIEPKPGVTITADVSELDTTKTEPVNLVESLGAPDTFTADITISEENTAENSDKDVTITATNAFGAVSTTVVVKLYNPTHIEFDLMLNAGTNLIAIPLADATVEGITEPIKKVKNFADALGDAWSLIVSLDTETGKFQSYTPNTPDDAKSNIDITGNTGLIVVMKEAKTLELKGQPWAEDNIVLEANLNLIGLPFKDESLVKASDIAERLSGNVNLIVSLNPEGGKFQSFIPGSTPLDAKSNITIDGGVGLILVMKSAGTLSVIGEPWSNDNRRIPLISAAPSREGLLMSDQTTSPVLQLDGAVTVNGLSVTTRNLSSGAVMTDTTADGRFSITFVDIVTNRAAKVGDVLEVSFSDPNGKFGVDSIRYTVTERDIQLGRIALGDLVAYAIPSRTELLQNWPNPFNPETWIPFKLKEASDTLITIYDVHGRIVRKFELGYIPAGIYQTKSKSAYWDGTNDMGERVASGIYFYHLKAGKFSAARKMVILK
jgi:hypothetical protein